jgi:hypothetical protein
VDELVGRQLEGDGVGANLLECGFHPGQGVGGEVEDLRLASPAALGVEA